MEGCLILGWWGTGFSNCGSNVKVWAELKKGKYIQAYIQVKLAY